MNKLTLATPLPSNVENSDSAEGPAPRSPVLFTAIGRQRVGKTALLNTVAQIYREAGAEFDVWNLDMMNESHSLSSFHTNTLAPASASIDDQEQWLQKRIQEQVRTQRDVLLDVGGGWTALHQLVNRTRLVDVLGRRGVNLTVAYVLGPETADLDYLAQFQRKGNFLPLQTLLVLNEGLISGSRDPHLAFEHIMAHPIVNQAISQGAQTLFMPALRCLSAVTDRKLSYRDFIDDKQVAGFPEASFFDQELVALWLEREMPAFLKRINPSWLPKLPNGTL